MSGGKKEISPDLVLRGHQDSVNALKFISIDLLASGDGKGHVKVWDLKTRRILTEFLDTHSSILSLSYISKMHRSARDGIIRVWETSRGSERGHVREIRCGVEHFCNTVTDLSQIDPFTLISPSCDENRGFLWDLREPCAHPASHFLLPEDCGMLSSLHYNHSLALSSETGSQYEGTHPGHILAGGEDGSLSVFDLRSLSRPIERRKLHQEPLLAISSSSGHIVTGGASREIQLMDNIPPSSTNPSDESTPYQQRTTLLVNPGTACCAVHQSGKIFLTGHWDGTVRLFTTKKMKPLAILSHHQSGVYSTDYSPTSTHGSIFATGSKDCTIAIWSLYSNQLLPTTEA